jgi:hypothetical protein
MAERYDSSPNRVLEPDRQLYEVAAMFRDDIILQAVYAESAAAIMSRMMAFFSELAEWVRWAYPSPK